MSKERRRLCLALAVIFVVNIAVICFAQSALAATYRRGSVGSVVTQIQTKLKDWGYYFYDVDGVYGSRTEAAVRWFQQKNGLNVDGLTGPATLEALGLPTGSTAADSNSGNLNLLARLISAEARNDPTRGRWPWAPWY